MVHFLLRRLFYYLAVLLGAALITFALMRAIPGNPWSGYTNSPRALIGLTIDKATQRELNRRYGLNLPLWRQFTRYMFGDVDEDRHFICGAVCGNLGPSIQQYGRSVQDILFNPPRGKGFWQSRFGYTIRLVFLAAGMAFSLGIVMGVLLAARPRAWLSRVLSVGLAALVSIPNFVLGLLAILVLASWLDLMQVLPDWSRPGDWIIPAFVLAALPMSNTARIVRTAMGQILHEDYVRTARAKGLQQRRVLWVHVFRNALIPIIAALGPAFMDILAGSFIVENLFSFPGFGREYWDAVLELDYPMVMGLTLIFAFGTLLVHGISTLAASLLDPRLRGENIQGVL